MMLYSSRRHTVPHIPPQKQSNKGYICAPQALHGRNNSPKLHKQ